MNHRNIIEAIEKQVKRAPDKVAIVFKNQSLTYQELSHYTNKLGSHLRSLGVGPEVLVGVCIDRSLWSVVGILGILKAGGSYVAVDPLYPNERMLLFLKESQARIVLTQSSLLEKLSHYVASKICIDRYSWDDLPEGSAESLASVITPNNLAYVMFTSGSTGRPKAVEMTHRSVYQYIYSIKQILQLSDEDVYLHTASFSFSSSVRQLFAPLCEGARVVIANHEQTKDPINLLSIVQKENVTVIDTVQSLWRHCLQALESHSYGDSQILLQCKIRTLVFSGESLSYKLLKRLRSLLNEQTKFINIYGQTETIGVCAYIVPHRFDREGGYVSVGYPLPHIDQLYLLDSNNNLITNDNPGELHIAGASLARGYLNNQELNKKSFIRMPLMEGQEVRLYKTGDFARYLPDGTLEIVGREDTQVKINGIRIELGEIESILELHPNVEQAIISTSVGASGDTYLFGYVLPMGLSEDGSQAALRQDIHSFLRTRLTSYMLPTYLVFLDKIPLTPNGKVDRIALLGEGRSLMSRDSQYKSPIAPTWIVDILSAIWADILGIEVSNHDNFIELGAHSLMAAQVISRVREAFGVEVELSALFDCHTLSEFAERVNTSIPAHLPPIIGSSLDGKAPLSFAQQRLWLLDQLDPGSCAYNMPYSYRLKGLLNVTVLERSLNEIMRRHGSLRTRIISVEGEPYQIITDNQKLSLSVVDLQVFTEDKREIEANQQVKDYAQQPFNLENSPLFRARLLKLAEDDHVLLMTIHHIISDAWSISVLLRELSVIYKSFVSSNPSPLPELCIQYSDFTAWQRKCFQGAMLKEHVEYWCQNLKNFTPLDLPTDYPRQTTQTYTAQTCSLIISHSLTQALKRISQRERSTLFMILLGAFVVLLSRLSGKNDISVGSPIAGRSFSEAESLIGLFINTVVLRTNLSDNPNFRQLLNQLRQVTLGSYKYQNLPFKEVSEELYLQHKISQQALFQVWINFLNVDMQPLTLVDLEVEHLQYDHSISKFELALYIKEKNEEIKMDLVFNADLFDSIRMVEMLKQYEYLLAQVVAKPDKSVTQYSLISPDARSLYELERQKNFSKVSIYCPKQFIPFSGTEILQSISSRFEKQVENYPENIAVQSSEHIWNYQILNLKANCIAHAILEVFNPNQGQVGLLLEHDALYIAAILGILKSGNCYVPLDPNYPHRRLSSILKDCQASVVLTNSDNLMIARDLANGDMTIINIDDLEFTHFWRNPELVINAHNPAYILYTSGSTGEPKGVFQSHRNVLHFICRYTNNLCISPSDKLSILVPYNFDASIMDIFGALLNGATLCAINPKVIIGLDLAQRLNELEITVYHSTPTLYRHLLGSLSQRVDVTKSLFSKIRLLVLGGEEVIKKDVDLYKMYFSDKCILINGLGPTESTVTLQYFINKDTQITGFRVPVGYPVVDTDILLVDEQGVNLELYGEIAVRSPYVALGYWQQDELSKSAFINDHAQTECRIYRTGDLGRLRSDGALEFVGRKDGQIKIRGFRIEPGEIEAALIQHDSIRNCIVITQENALGDKFLVAYIVILQAQEPTQVELRHFLQQTLPDYMVPSVFVILEELPLTHNGKIDRRVLPTPPRKVTPARSTHTLPRNITEAILTQIWEEVFGLEVLDRGRSSINIYDNFFEIGGYSLVGAQLISRVRETFQIELPFQCLFDSPTIVGLASQIRNEQWASSLRLRTNLEHQSSLVAIQSGSSSRPFFLIPGGYGREDELIIYAKLIYRLDHDQPVYGFRARGWDRVQSTHTSVEAMATDYIKEILDVQSEGPYLLGGECIGGIVALEMAQQLVAQGKKVGLLVLMDTVRPTLHRELTYYTKQFLGNNKSKVFRVHNLLQKLKSLSKGDRVNYILNQASKVKEMFREDDFSHALLDVKNYIRIIKHYRPQIYPGKITMFLTESFSPKAQYQEWRNLAMEGVIIHQLLGTHNSYLDQDVETTAKLLMACIKEAQTS